MDSIPRLSRTLSLSNMPDATAEVVRRHSKKFNFSKGVATQSDAARTMQIAPLAIKHTSLILKQCRRVATMPRLLHAGESLEAPDGRRLCLVLNEKEAALQQTLLSVCREHKLDTQVRFAGGWVRDKLLGLPSDDIDIALSNMQGATFAELCQAHVKKHAPLEKTATIHEIKTNPDKSKHLATATMKLEGYMCDMVNLRAETYSDTSRIPEIRFGEPLEDAQRRDLTINALFYNLHTQAVEDWTEMGMDDLLHGIIRTPIEPVQTFLDDPLRMLRVIRFASRFNFKIEESVLEALQAAQVKAALANAEKISRERIGVEVAKMLSSSSPLYAIELLLDTSLLSTIFDLPEPIWQRTLDRATHLLRLCEKADSDAPYYVERGTDAAKRLLLAAILFPIKQEMVPQKNVFISKVKWLVLNHLKWSASDAEAVGHMVVEAAKLVDKDDWQVALTQLQSDRVQLGQWIRHCKAAWPSVLALAAAEKANEDTTAQTTLDAFCQSVAAGKLQNAYEWKPLLNGKEMIQLGAKPGKVLGELMEELMTLQLARQDLTKEDATELMREKIEHRAF